MTALRLALLVLAGIGGGLTGSIAGLASLVSYPALLAVGLPAVSANVSNTVALIGQGVGTAVGTRPELAGQGRRLRRLSAIAALGGAVGGTLLLLTPAEAFEKVVPWLIGVAALAVLLRPRTVLERADPHGDAGLDGSWVQAGVFLIGIYGGYFGAAAGVMMLALLLYATGEPLPRAAAGRSVVLGAANAVAALGFVAFGPVNWPATVALAVGFLIGGRIGPVVVRHSPAGVLRVLIAAAGLGLAVKLGLDAY